MFDGSTTMSNGRYGLPAVVMCSLLVLLFGCESTPPHARDVWKKALASCSTQDTLKPDELLYLGPSNVYGPGSAWRVTENGNFEPRWDFVAAVPDEQARERMIVRGRNADCSTSGSAGWSISPTLLLDSGTLRVPVQLQAELADASSAEVRVTTWRLDRLNELEYERWLKGDSGEYAADVREHPFRRRIMKSAVLVEGFTARFDYASSSNAAARFAIQDKLELGSGLTLLKTSVNQLVLESREPFYIVGTLLAITPEGFPMTGGPEVSERLLDPTPLKIDLNARTVAPSLP